MIIFKNQKDTLGGVLKNSKHASDGIPHNIKYGDIILIAQTKNTLEAGQKSIRWIMNYETAYEDLNNETDSIWKKHWRYIIKGYGLRPVEPFDIKDLQISDKDYGAIQTHGPINPEDEYEVLKWIGEVEINSFEEGESIAEEFTYLGISPVETIKMLDQKYAGTPQYAKKIVFQLQRPSGIRKAVIERDGTKCKICGIEGFMKRDGSRYAETHHMIELNQMAPNTLMSWNVLVLCPTCHKKLHYADIESEFLDPGWRIKIDGKDVIIK